MYKTYQLSHGDKVLLLGEGNFSFSKDFIVFNEKLLSHVEIVSTCRESNSENLSEFKLENVNYLLSRGVCVLFNVDATNLKYQPTIKDQKYNKIIFNFPHVGGKMKIHLNRKLLKDFFTSACDVLDDNGCIVVALCDGQGGTEVDKKKRSWNDSWQITEMAAQSDLILYCVEPFDVKCFPNYVNVGYRSCEKSFHCENAIVHSFRRQSPPCILQEDPDKWMRVEGCNEQLIVDTLNKHLVNPWSNPQSASSYIYKRLLEKLGVECYQHRSILQYSFPMPINDPNNISVNNGDISCSLLDIFNAVKVGSSGNGCVIVRVLMNQKPVNLKQFSYPPVRCQALVFGLDTSSLFSQYLIDMLEAFGSEWKMNIVNEELINCKFTLCGIYHSQPQTLTVIESLLLLNGIPCHIVHIDELAQILFDLKDWRSLWDGRVEFSCKEKPRFYPTVLYPREYAFDLGLSVPLHLKDGFEEEFFLTLWRLAGDLIVKVEHLTTYVPTDRELICYCYRITYKSHNSPLYRKRVIHFHENIIGKIISRTLQVNIT